MATPFSETDDAHMRRALTLARRGQGAVEPNPMVGAVIVRDGRVVGEGFHRRYGGPHAEVEALRQAGRRARGATLYVTLEPCCHWGKTPPCTDAILAAHISRVVAATRDPFAKVGGRGIALLRRRGVRVDVGLRQDEARLLNAPFLTGILKHRPYIIAKWAQSLDGCVAAASGRSQWISSETSRAFVHYLRGRVDAIIIGLGTALADDPLLTARPASPRFLHRVATRIVVDSRCRLPLAGRLVRTVSDAPLMVAHAAGLRGAAERRRRSLAQRGVMTVPLPTEPRAGGRIRLNSLLKHLARLEYANVLVEGGPELLASFFAQRLVDEAHVFIAPMIIGGRKAPHAVGGSDIPTLAAATRFTCARVAPSGPDLHLVLRPKLRRHSSQFA